MPSGSRSVVSSAQSLGLKIASAYPRRKTSAWRSLDELFEPLVECYDAFGIADDHLYTLTIERGPWDARFA